MFLQGHQHLNRAVQGDVVAVEMLPEEEWTCPSSMVMEETETTEEKADEDTTKQVRGITLYDEKAGHLLFHIKFHVFVVNISKIVFISVDYLHQTLKNEIIKCTTMRESLNAVVTLEIDDILQAL